MKKEEIAKVDLKIGDWVKTEDIFDMLDKNGGLICRYTILKIEDIIIEPKRKTFKVKSWVKWGEEISVGPLPEKIGTLYPIENEELMEIKKELILQNLDENKRNKI